MSHHNHITVRGRVGTDPELSITPNDHTVVHFRLGSTRRFRDSSGQWHDAETEWFTVKAWGTMADAVLTSINRGMPVIVEGTFSTEEWQSGEQTRYKKVITASAVGVDIRYGLVRHVKVSREALTGVTGSPSSTGPTASSPDSGPAPAEDPTAATGPDLDAVAGTDAAGTDVAASLDAEADPWATTSAPSS